MISHGSHFGQSEGAQSDVLQSMDGREYHKYYYPTPVYKM
jgi:hypothetical protein